MAVPTFKTSRLEEDRVKWEDLPAFTKEFDWLLSSSSDDFFEWIKVQSQDLCEGSRVLTEVKIFKICCTRQQSKSCKGNRWCFRTWGILKLLPILRTFTLPRHFRHHVLRCTPNESSLSKP